MQNVAYIAKISTKVAKELVFVSTLYVLWAQK